MSRDTTKLILSVDVEDWFHIIAAGGEYAFRSQTGGVHSWPHFQPRVEANTHWILDTLDRHAIKATFFVLGWVAEKHPQLVREIDRRGHEVASHGHWHSLLSASNSVEFLNDLHRSVHALEDLIGRKVLGYRATSASITQWALDILAEEGLLYDSSVYPATYHDTYGKIAGLDPLKPIERMPNGLWEVKMSSLQIGNLVLPWGGGGYFRLIPYPLFKRGIDRIVRQQRLYLFYLHPWELDPDAPRFHDLKYPYYFRRYVSISKTRARFEKLLCDFQFVPVSDVLSTWIGKDRTGSVPGGKPSYLHETGADTESS
jgi:polysaccharide deacetylase family protein (PEP-CTERM system associated)